MKKNMKVLIEFFRACMVEELEYRTNFFGNMLTSLFWIVIAVLTVDVFFNQTNQLGGWSYYEVLVLLGVFNTINGFIEFALRQNMARIVDHIRKGTLDYVLTKPVDSQFFVSFRHLVFWRLADIFWGCALIVYALAKLGRWPSVLDFVLFLILLLAAMVLVYSIWMILMTTSFWFVKIEILSFIFSSFFETTRFPVQVYKGWLRILLTFILPAAFMTSVPSAALTGKWDVATTVIALLVALGFFVVSRVFWKVALKSYTSASS